MKSILSFIFSYTMIGILGFGGLAVGFFDVFFISGGDSFETMSTLGKGGFIACVSGLALALFMVIYNVTREIIWNAKQKKK